MQARTSMARQMRSAPWGDDAPTSASSAERLRRSWGTGNERGFCFVGVASGGERVATAAAGGDPK